MSDFTLDTKFEGDRFEGVVLPSKHLSDLVLIQSIIKLIAEILWKEDSADALPKGFNKINWKFKFTEGSTCVGVTGQHEQIQISGGDLYHQLAMEKFPEIIDTINDNGEFYFNNRKLNEKLKKFGSDLRENETISVGKSKFTIETRRKIKTLEIIVPTSVVTLTGTVHELDLSLNSFKILCWSKKFNGKYSEKFKEDIFEAFERSKIGDIVDLKAKVSGRRILEIIKIQKRTSLDDQLKELLQVEKGWIGEGSEAPNHEQVGWMREFLPNYDFPLPRIYPTEDGGFLFEWMFGRDDVSLEFLKSSLEFDPENQKVEWHHYNLDSKEENFQTMNFFGMYDWIFKKLVKQASI